MEKRNMILRKTLKIEVYQMLKKLLKEMVDILWQCCTNGWYFTIKCSLYSKEYLEKQKDFVQVGASFLNDDKKSSKELK
jgi:hypothetical protein